jgi:hypothetical protein
MPACVPAVARLTSALHGEIQDSSHNKALGKYLPVYHCSGRLPFNPVPDNLECISHQTCWQTNESVRLGGANETSVEATHGELPPCLGVEI